MFSVGTSMGMSLMKIQSYLKFCTPKKKKRENCVYLHSCSFAFLSANTLSLSWKPPIRSTILAVERKSVASFFFYHFIAPRIVGVDMLYIYLCLKTSGLPSWLKNSRLTGKTNSSYWTKLVRPFTCFRCVLLLNVDSSHKGATFRAGNISCPKVLCHK